MSIDQVDAIGWQKKIPEEKKKTIQKKMFIKISLIINLFHDKKRELNMRNTSLILRKQVAYIFIGYYLAIVFSLTWRGKLHNPKT